MRYEVIIVDDEDIIIKLVRHLIIKSDLHQDPKGFLSGQDALEHLSLLNETALPQIILLDINMPDLDGWDFLDFLMKSDLKKNIYVVIITSSINKSDKIKAETYDIVAGHIEKPVSMKNMEEIKNLKSLESLFHN
ncbi:CheY-like receiver domain-containing protein [Belliella baltica DSM 15883]|uniref:CheY-like receiver domain-containing protein n=1 Tax=Belliella baltica (strain DSM 15883 / CIP 108006 / LMG 21964 / BA134) TaxID=866536 RepID=I3Z7B6_BELBD|nr:response regulator [Belliella baltica]AFL85134.1 CheY-like receiver domain-containing protein [Belliella baltica DSM 15883]